jgi:hypothetical protein
MFRIFLPNFGYCPPKEFSTVKLAKEAGVRIGFQFTVIDESGKIHYSNVV